MSEHTAETVYHALRKLPVAERARFFTLLAQAGLHDQDHSHEDVFGHLAGAEFTASDAAEYLEVSMSTFRRYVQGGRITPSIRIGRSCLFATSDLKKFKQAQRRRQ